MQKQHHSQKTAQKSASTSSNYGDISNTPNSTAPTSEWVHETEDATLLAIKQNTLRAMRRDGRLIPGDHWLVNNRGRWSHTSLNRGIYSASFIPHVVRGSPPDANPKTCLLFHSQEWLKQSLSLWFGCSLMKNG